MHRVHWVRMLLVAAATGVGGLVGGLLGAAVGAVLAGTGIWLAWRSGHRLVLRWLEARPFGSSLREQRIEQLVRDAAERLGTPVPELWRCNAPHVNAFAIATGRQRVLCVTDGLLRESSRAHVSALLTLQVARLAGRAAEPASMGAILGGVGSAMGRLGMPAHVEHHPNPLSAPLAILTIPLAAWIASRSVDHVAEREAFRVAARHADDEGVLRRALERIELLAHAQPMPVPAALGHLGIVAPHLGAPPLALARAYSTGWPVVERMRWLEGAPAPDGALGGRGVPEAA